MTALEKLRLADVTVDLISREERLSDTVVDALIEISAGESPIRFVVEEKQRAPYPNELVDLDRCLRSIKPFGYPLLVVPYVPVPLGAALTDAGWSWADDQGNYDIRAPGLRLRQRLTTSPPTPARRLLPGGPGSWAVIRSLIGFRNDEDEEPNATSLARQARISQPRVSQVLSALGQLGLVERNSKGRWRPDRPALLDRLLAEYPGPGGTEALWYSLDPPSKVAADLAHRLSSKAFAVSADVGPDLIAPWRRPSILIIYTANEVPREALGLVDAQGLADANVIVREPRDRSVYPTPLLVAEADGVEIPLVDPTQMIWDLQHLGGADRFETAGEVRKWLLERR